MAEPQQRITDASATPTFRIDPKLHQILYKPSSRPPVSPPPESEGLPEPPYPIHPNPQPMTKKEYQKLNAIRTWKTWGSPYFKSLYHRGELRPIIPYLFTEWKCNYDCHYCWSYNNKVKGMTEDVARRSIDWLHSIGSRRLALMGGRPLLRPMFIPKIGHYSPQQNNVLSLPPNHR